jgi:hypothetical protein
MPSKLDFSKNPFFNEKKLKPYFVAEVMDEWDRKFGQTYGYFSGIKPMLVIRDLELVKQVLRSIFNTFNLLTVFESFYII